MTDAVPHRPRVAEDHLLLLQSVLLSGDDAQEAFAKWRATVDIDLVDWPSQRLLPLLARQLPDVAPDDPVRGLVRGVYRHAWARNHLLWRDAVDVLHALRARGIPTILLKGAALLDAYGGDWGARPMYDVDVLVPTADASSAIDVLVAAGWEPEQGQTAPWLRYRGVPRRHAWGFTRGDGRLDLHWHVLPDSIGARADDRFWANARSCTIAGEEVRVLAAGDLLVHVLVHGTATMNAPPVQWIADAVMVMRAAGDERLYDRVAATARRHGELATVTHALSTVGDVLGGDVVAAASATLRRERPAVVERVRRLGERNEPVRQLARRAAGGEGLVRGAVELVGERLELDLSTHSLAAVTHAVTLRSPSVASAWRRRVGSFVRTAVDDPPPIAAGEVLDFGDPPTLDRCGTVGWGRSQPTGSTTQGAEPRLALPLAPELLGVDLVLTLELAARDRDTQVVILANERRVATAIVTVDGTELRVRIPAPVVQRFSPLELAFRNASRRLPPASVRLRLRRLEIGVPAAP